MMHSRADRSRGATFPHCDFNGDGWAATPACLVTSPFSNDPAFGHAVRWLTAHAGFPARRLPANAKLLVLLAAAAGAQARAAPARQDAQIGRPGGPSTTVRLRNYAIQRNHAHARCDNSAKV